IAHLGGKVKVLLPILLEVAVRVEQLELVGRLQERHALALAVDVNEKTADLFEGRDGDRLIVDVRLTAAAAIKAARQDQVLIVEFGFEDAFDLGTILVLLQLEATGDAQLLGASAEQFT